MDYKDFMQNLTKYNIKNRNPEDHPLELEIYIPKKKLYKIEAHNILEGICKKDTIGKHICIYRYDKDIGYYECWSDAVTFTFEALERTLAEIKKITIRNHLRIYKNRDLYNNKIHLAHRRTIKGVIDDRLWEDSYV